MPENKHKSYLLRKGFTMAEVLVALMVSSIVLAAAAALAYAMDSAESQTDNMSLNQAEVRTATVHIRELLENAKLICAQNGDDIVVWREDSNNNNKINVSELTYIEAGPNRAYLRLMRYNYMPSWIRNGYLEKGDFEPGAQWNKEKLMMYCTEKYTPLIVQCRNVEYEFDDTPMDTKRVVISFEIENNGKWEFYQISACLRGYASNLIGTDGSLYYSDDD